MDRSAVDTSCSSDSLNWRDWRCSRHRGVQAGGRPAITFQPRGVQPGEAGASAFARRVADLLTGVGLTDLRIEKLPMAPVCAVCVRAQKAELWDPDGETARM